MTNQAAPGGSSGASAALSLKPPLLLSCWFHSAAGKQPASLFLFVPEIGRSHSGSSPSNRTFYIYFDVFIEHSSDSSFIMFCIYSPLNLSSAIEPFIHRHKDRVTVFILNCLIIIRRGKSSGPVGALPPPP